MKYINYICTISVSSPYNSPSNIASKFRLCWIKISVTVIHIIQGHYGHVINIYEHVYMIYDMWRMLRPVLFNMSKVQTVIVSVDGGGKISQPRSQWLLTEHCLTKSQHNCTTRCCAGVSAVTGDKWRRVLTYNCIKSIAIHRISQNINGNQSNLKS